MEEAARLCSEIAIVDHGRIISQGAPRALLASHFGDSVIEIPHADLQGSPDELPGTVVDLGDRYEVFTRDVRATIEALLACDSRLDNLIVRERTLEDLFLELTGRELRA
jgi:ABC-2 type transport system ATP-binding protein